MAMDAISITRTAEPTYPAMFAEVAQDRRTAKDAARTCNRTFREVFQTWLNLGKL